MVAVLNILHSFSVTTFKYSDSIILMHYHFNAVIINNNIHTQISLFVRVAVGMGILWEWEIFLAYGNPVGNRHFHMWESCGNSHRNLVGMGWEWE